MFAPLQPALARLEAAALELRAATEAVLAEVAVFGAANIPIYHSAALLDQLLSLVAIRYGLSVNDLRSPSRAQPVVMVRQVAMSICREHSPASLQAIGKALRRDHGTVLYACQSIAARRATDSHFAAEYAAISRAAATLAGRPSASVGDSAVRNPQSAIPLTP